MYFISDIVIFFIIYQYAAESEVSRPYSLDCVVNNWKSMICTFEPPQNTSNWTIRYSYCYGCVSYNTLPCPYFYNKICTWSKKELKKEFEYTIFICDDKNNNINSAAFFLKTIVKYDPVKKLNVAFLTNDSVNISWNSGSEHFKYEVILKDNDTKEVLSNDTCFENHIKYISLRPQHGFEVSVRRKMEGFWSEPTQITFESGEEDFTHGGMLRMLGFHVLKMDGRKKEVLLRWEILRKYISIKMFTIKVSSIARNLSIIIVNDNILHTSRSHRIMLDDDDDDDLLFKVTLTCVTANGKHSDAEIVISLGEDISDCSEPPLLLIRNSSTMFASLSWSSKVIVNGSTLFFDVHDYVSPNDPLVEIGNIVPPPISTEFSSFEAPSLADHRLHLSLQRVVAIDDEKVLVHGPMIAIVCRHYLNEDLPSPSNLTFLKDSTFNSMTLTWKSQLECGSKYFTHLVVEYYATDCESCSNKASTVVIPRLAANWTIDGLIEGPYQLRMKGVCNVTDTYAESPFTHFITVRVSGRRDMMSLTLSVSVSSMIILLIVAAVIGSRTHSSVKSKVVIDIPTSPYSDYSTTGLDKPSYHMSAIKLNLRRAKSLYKSMFRSENDVFQSQGSILDRQNLLAWWNPSYWVFQKHSFVSSPSLIDDPYLREVEACSGNLYIGGRAELDLYSSVKILGGKQTCP